MLRIFQSSPSEAKPAAIRMGERKLTHRIRIVALSLRCLSGLEFRVSLFRFYAPSLRISSAPPFHSLSSPSQNQRGGGKGPLSDALSSWFYKTGDVSASVRAWAHQFPSSSPRLAACLPGGLRLEGPALGLVSVAALMQMECAMRSRTARSSLLSFLSLGVSYCSAPASWFFLFRMRGSGLMACSHSPSKDRGEAPPAAWPKRRIVALGVASAVPICRG